MAFDGRTRVVTLPGVFITETTPAGDGTTLAVKDLFDTAGVRTTYGSAVFADHVPDETAEAVTRLERAGYASVGKANLHEFAWGITSENPHYGWVPNPLAEGRIAGGSSGGCAAALAAGLADAALGTDSAGSIRIPAACCGIAGFKPTHGLVPLDGCFPLAKSFDHAGPMARDVAGCARMMEALAPGLEAVTLDSLADLRVGVAWTGRADPLVRERVEAAVAAFPGARALALTDAEVAEAWAERDRYRAQIAAITEDVDLVVCPTLEMVAPPAGVGDLALRERVILLTFPWSVVGAPVLALPCGPAELGLPASLQLVGRPGDDALVLAAGALLERAIGSPGGASGTL